jgi:hypothetical protein
VKWQTAPAFDADVRKLTSEELKLFRNVVRERFVPAADRVAADPAAKWPAGLRVKDVEGADGIWEMTWSFAEPDGRATFEWTEIVGERAIRWRRVGGHEIFNDPAR